MEEKSIRSSVFDPMRPFLVERHLEDYADVASLNKNPLRNEATKAEIPRSETFSNAPSMNDEAFRTRMINNIVREVTGDQSFGKVQTIGSQSLNSLQINEKQRKKHKLDSLKAYDQESSYAVTFGHRPDSASLLFNPSTSTVKKNKKLKKLKVAYVGMSVSTLKRMIEPTDEQINKQKSLTKSLNELDSMSKLTLNSNSNYQNTNTNERIDPKNLFSLNDEINHDDDYLKSYDKYETSIKNISSHLSTYKNKMKKKSVKLNSIISPVSFILFDLDYVSLLYFS